MNDNSILTTLPKCLIKCAPYLLEMLCLAGCMRDESYYPGQDTDSSGNISIPEDTAPKGDGGTQTEDTDLNDTGAENHPSDMSSAETAPKVKSSHDGWKNPSCMAAACHGDIRSDATTAADCAACHGGNGALPCRAGNISGCLDCHDSPHAPTVATDNEHCEKCHV